VHAARTSERVFLGGKTILEIPQERKKNQDMPNPGKYHTKLQGIMSQKPSSVIPVKKLVHMADKVGVDINSKTQLGPQDAAGNPDPNNPFYLLSNTHTCAAALTSVHYAIAIDNVDLHDDSYSSPHTPDHLRGGFEDHEESIWYMETKHRRGKHPKKKTFP
jgi:hypothetical protein